MLRTILLIIGAFLIAYGIYYFFFSTPTTESLLRRYPNWKISETTFQSIPVGTVTSFTLKGDIITWIRKDAEVPFKKIEDNKYLKADDNSFSLTVDPANAKIKIADESNTGYFKFIPA